MNISGEQIMEQHLEKASWAEIVDSLNSLEPRDNYIVANTEPNSFNLFSSSGTITKRRFQFQFISRRNGYQGEWKAQPMFCGLVLRSHFFEKGCGGALRTDGGQQTTFSSPSALSPQHTQSTPSNKCLTTTLS
ncbi:hypothetical protein V6N13_060266 [Hibiscus sabdariffa]